MFLQSFAEYFPKRKTITAPIYTDTHRYACVRARIYRCTSQQMTNVDLLGGVLSELSGDLADD